MNAVDGQPGYIVPSKTLSAAKGIKTRIVQPSFQRNPA